MIFANPTFETIIQVDDLTRLSFDLHSPNNDLENIDQVFIKPDTLAIEYDAVSKRNNYYIDWAYNIEGVKTIELKVIMIDTTEHIFNGELTVLNKEEDNLFSSDQDLIQVESDILRYLPSGKSTFNYLHREAQKRIMAFLDEQRIWKIDGSRYLISDVSDIEEFKQWSRYLVLHILYRNLVVVPDDVFDDRAKYYADLMASARKRAAIRIGRDDDPKNKRVIDRFSSILIRR